MQTEATIERKPFAWRFSLSQLLAALAGVAIYFGALATAARAFQIAFSQAFSIWVSEFASLPMYALWIVAASVIFAHRNTCPTSAKYALLGLLGFGITSALNAMFSMWFMSALIAAVSAPQAQASMGGVYVFFMYLGQPLLEAVCWALLLLALLKAFSPYDFKAQVPGGDMLNRDERPPSPI